MKERLTRLDQIYRDPPVFFIICGTHHRQKILAHEIIHAAFKQFCTQASERHILVGRYVIMPDHLHLFVHLPEAAGLSSWIKSLKNTISRTLGSFTPAPHWQKGYFDHLLRSEISYDEKWDYVRMNPLRQGLIDVAEKWPFQEEIERLPFA